MIASHSPASQRIVSFIPTAMCYDDLIRVDDLKTRGKRFARIQSEMGIKSNNVLQLTEFMHPRAEKIVELLPARLGERISNDPKWMTSLDRFLTKRSKVTYRSVRWISRALYFGWQVVVAPLYATLCSRDGSPGYMAEQCDGL